MLVTSRCVADSVFEQSWVEASRVSANAIFAECLDIASQHERGLEVEKNVLYLIFLFSLTSNAEWILMFFFSVRQTKTDLLLYL